MKSKNEIRNRIKELNTQLSFIVCEQEYVF